MISAGINPFYERPRWSNDLDACVGQVGFVFSMTLASPLHRSMEDLGTISIDVCWMLFITFSAGQSVHPLAWHNSEMVISFTNVQH